MSKKIKPQELMPQLPQDQHQEIIPDGEALERSFSQMQNRNEGKSVV